jgi:hypothetical protein
LEGAHPFFDSRIVFHVAEQHLPERSGVEVFSLLEAFAPPGSWQDLAMWI